MFFKMNTIQLTKAVASMCKRKKGATQLFVEVLETQVEALPLHLLIGD